MSISVSAITTYPIKGFPGQIHDSMMALEGAVLPGDRAYGLTSGTQVSQQADKHSWLKKSHFLQMMTKEALAGFALSFDESTSHLKLMVGDELFFDGHLQDEESAAALCKKIASYLSYDEVQEIPRLFHMKQGGLTDTKTPFVAFGNQASMTDFAQKVNIDDDDRRYRLNIMLSGLPAFGENDLLGKTARIGAAEFHFVEPVGRCAAIEVAPKTAVREKGLVSALQNHYGMTDMGLFASVTKTGQISVGDKVEII